MLFPVEAFNEKRGLMQNLPFDKPGKFWRGNLHTHTTRSDGRLSAEDVCQYYRHLGWHFIAITDHFMPRYNYPLTDRPELHADDFITLVGAELHAGETIASGMWHILAVGLPPDFPQNLPDEDGPGIAKRALDAGAYVAVAHPAWYNLTEADVLALGGEIPAIEIYNGISADHNDRPDSWYMLDAMLAQGQRYHGCATDDAHFHDRHRDVGRGWVEVKAESLTRESIMAAIKAGHYYSSTGPQIHNIELKEGNRVLIECSPATNIFVTGTGSHARQLHGNNLRRAELRLPSRDAEYLRVTVRDADGGRAWSNPIWLD
jgi:hypothetical protein